MLRAMSSRPRRGAYHHGDLPAALVDAAIALLSEEGEEALALRAVARRVGVDHSAAYRHFEDKTALRAAIAERGYRELTSAMRAAVEQVPAEDPSGRLISVCGAYVRFALDRSALFRVTMGPRLNQDGRFPALELAVSEAFDLLKSLIADGIARGVLDDLPLRDAAGCVWSAAHGFAVLVLDGRIPLRPERIDHYVPTILGPVIRGLEKSPRPRAPRDDA